MWQTRAHSLTLSFLLASFATCKALVEYDPTYGLTLTLRRTSASTTDEGTACPRPCPCQTRPVLSCANIKTPRDADYDSEIRVRGEQLTFIREALGPLNEGVAFVCRPSSSSSSSSSGGTQDGASTPVTYLFECAEERELNEDPVIEALLKIRNFKAHDDDSKEGLLRRLSEQTPVLPEHIAAATEVSKHTGKLLFYRQELSNFDVLADTASISIYKREKYDGTSHGGTARCTIVCESNRWHRQRWHQQRH